MISHTPESLQKLQRTSWGFQRTFKTPLAHLPGFVSVIVSAHPDLSRASLLVEAVVFEPKHPPAFVPADQWRALARATTVIADSQAAARPLLAAALSDWLDFFFVPEPKPFVIYADHDEYCTFYANTRSNLNRVCDPLVQAGFQAVAGYER